MIDMTLKVGRLVARRSDEPGFRVDRNWTGVITEVSGKRAQFKRRLPDGTTEPRFILEKTVAAVCDTEDELARVLEVSNSIHRRYSEVMDALDAQWSTLFDGGQA